MLDTCPPYKHNASQARYNLTRFADSKYCGLSKLFLRQRWGKISGFARGREGKGVIRKQGNEKCFPIGNFMNNYEICKPKQ
jgi:hypothetical protein